MTSASQLNPRKTCRPATYASSANVVENISRISTIDDQQNHTSSEEHSCLAVLRHWFRNVFRRGNRPDDVKNQQSEETSHHRVAFDRGESHIYESLEENSIKYHHQRTSQGYQLFPLKQPYATIKIVDRNSVSIACNDHHMLIKQAPYLCLLDKQLTIVKEILWGYDHVDISWSQILHRFILIGEKNIFIFDEETSKLEQYSIHLNHEKEWSSGACSESSLFLAIVGLPSSVYEYTLQPSIELVKEWKLFDSHVSYDAILTLTYGNEKLALVISNARTYQKRVDLRSSRTLEYLWSVPLDTIAHCCLIYDDQWMIMESFKSRFLHISSDGQFLQEHHVERSSMEIIWNAVQFDRETIVSFTVDSLNLHKLS